MPTIYQCHRETDKWTTYDSNTALALRELCCKNQVILAALNLHIVAVVVAEYLYGMSKRKESHRKFTESSCVSSSATSSRNFFTVAANNTIITIVLLTVDNTQEKGFVLFHQSHNS